MSPPSSWASSGTRFKKRWFEKDIILQSVRWYVAYPLSYRQIEEMMGERGIEVDHSTINRWVVKYSPDLEKEFRKKKLPVGSSWRVDETYVKVKGKWKYLYRAVDKSGANKAAVDAVNNELKSIDVPEIELRQVKYLNNIIEQDHRSIKRIIRPTHGFKSFRSAKKTIAGIELMHMLRKGQCPNPENRSPADLFYGLAG